MNDDIIISNYPVKPGPWKVLTIIFAVTTVAAAIAAGFFFVSNSNNSAELAKLRQQQQTAAIESSVSDAKILGFAPSAITNGTNSSTYTFSFADDFNLFASFALSADGKTIAYALNATEFARLYGANTLPASGELKFSQPVVDVYFGKFGQASGEERILFLMEDGTVEYIDLAAAVRNNAFVSAGAIEDLSDISKFYTATVAETTEEGAPAGSGVTTLAQSTDGTIYDLNVIFQGMNAASAETNCDPNDAAATNCINPEAETPGAQ